MKTRKFLRVMGIIELILAIAFVIIAFVGLKRSSEAMEVFNNGGIRKIVLLLILFAFPAIRIIGGLWGIIARGRTPMMVLGFLMSIEKVPDIVKFIMEKNQTTSMKMWLVLDIVTIVISVMYFVGALLYRKPPKPGKGPGGMPPKPPHED